MYEAENIGSILGSSHFDILLPNAGGEILICCLHIAVNFWASNQGDLNPWLYF